VDDERDRRREQPPEQRRVEEREAHARLPLRTG
jgi:hypothetical protein